LDTTAPILVPSFPFDITETSRLATVVEEEMVSGTSSSPVQRFGGFEVDPRSRELRRKGIHIRMQDQQLEILVMLVECKGEAVTREELKERLWPAGTFVATDDGLNTQFEVARSSGRLRLGSDLIETIPRRGYRSIAPIEHDVSVATQEPVEVPHRRDRGHGESRGSIERQFSRRFFSPWREHVSLTGQGSGTPRREDAMTNK
jgi:DNA-binding winged helix-turn-helix (wHTH) protein